MFISDCGAIVTDKLGRELQAHGTNAFPIACYHDDLASADCGWHWHDELELILVSEGCANAAAGCNTYTLHTGEGLFVNSSVLHALSIKGAPPCRLHSITFHPRLIGGNSDSIYWQKYLQPLMTDAALQGLPLSPGIGWQSELLTHLEAAWQACKNEPKGFEFYVRTQLSQIIFLLHENAAASRSKEQLSEKALRDGTRIKQMLQYIHAHYSEPLTTSQIAESSMVSESEALRCFHAMIRTTPIQYLRQYRLECATKLLATTHEKISAIAFRCGFQEMSYFAHAFRSQYGCTPSEYRKQHR